MRSLTSIVIGCVLATGCKDKAENKQPQAGSAQPTVDAKWIEKLPSVSGGDTRLLLQNATGVVRIAADGSLSVATAPTSAAIDPLTAAKPVKIGELATALGLRPLTQEQQADASFAQLGHPVSTQGAPAPAKRMTSVFGLAHSNDAARVIVFADATAPAHALVDVLSATGGFLAVRRGMELGALPIALDRLAPALASPLQPWFELRLGAVIELESVPSKPAHIAAIDKVGEAVKAAGAKAVDVLVDGSAKVQDVVAVVEQLRAAGVDAIGLGSVPGADSGSRGEQTARVLAWDLHLAEGDKAQEDAIRASLVPAFEPMRKCYTAALAKINDAGGVATLDVTVAASGKVQRAQASFDPGRAIAVATPLAACAVAAAKATKFPARAVHFTTTLAFLPR